MPQAIGFASFPKGWEGPVVLEFELHTDHSRVVRYRCRLENRQFDLYIPKFLLAAGPAATGPLRIRVAIGRSRERFRTMGFLGKPDTPVPGERICTYDFSEAKANSIRYDLLHGGQRYSLYVPREVFRGEAPPKRVFLFVEVPEGTLGK